MIYYPEGLHRMPPYADGAPDLPETDRACREVLSLPMHPHLTPDHVAYVAEAVRAFVSEPVLS